MGGREGWPPSFSNYSFSPFGAQLPRAVHMQIVEEAYPICVLTVRMYLKQLGPRSVITRNAYTHLRKLALILNRKVDIRLK